MLISLFILLLISNAVTLRRDKSILFSRIVIVALICTSFLSLKTPFFFVEGALHLSILGGISNTIIIVLLIYMSIYWPRYEINIFKYSIIILSPLLIPLKILILSLIHPSYNSCLWDYGIMYYSFFILLLSICLDYFISKRENKKNLHRLKAIFFSCLRCAIDSIPYVSLFEFNYIVTYITEKEINNIRENLAHSTDLMRRERMAMMRHFAIHANLETQITAGAAAGINVDDLTLRLGRSRSEIVTRYLNITALVNQRENYLTHLRNNSETASLFTRTYTVTAVVQEDIDRVKNKFNLN